MISGPPSLGRPRPSKTRPSMSRRHAELERAAEERTFVSDGLAPRVPSNACTSATSPLTSSTLPRRARAVRELELDQLAVGDVDDAARRAAAARRCRGWSCTRGSLALTSRVTARRLVGATPTSCVSMSEAIDVELGGDGRRSRQVLRARDPLAHRRREDVLERRALAVRLDAPCSWKSRIVSSSRSCFGERA